MSQNNGLWPPCFSKSRDKIFPQIKVSYASGGWLYTENDRIFDATSSWWCKHLGHRHPAIIQAMKIQSEQYIHAIEGIALIIGIDRILDMLRTAVNITGDAVVAFVINHSENTSK